MANWGSQTIVSGRYRVLRRLARGGYGEVYLAWDDNLGRQVVLKAPRTSWLEEPDFAERYRREIQALVKLRHPHVVPVYDDGEHDGRPYTVMEYLSGGTLADRLDVALDSGSGPDRLGDWLPQVAAALDFMHARGYVHRDVKPSNIVFDGAGAAYLTDFGIAKVVFATQQAAHRSLTSTGVLAGTPQFMSPEACLGYALDGRCDQYALGVIAYWCLCGILPLEGATPVATAMLHVTRPPLPLEERVPELPLPLCEAVHRALAKSPEQRHETCGEFARSVVAALAVVGRLPSESSGAAVGTSRAIGTAATGTTHSSTDDPRDRPSMQPAVQTDTWRTSLEDTRKSRPAPHGRASTRRLKWMAGAGVLIAAGLLVAAFAGSFLADGDRANRLAASDETSSAPEESGVDASAASLPRPFDPDTDRVAPRRPEFGSEVPGIRRLKGHAGDVFGLAWSPEGGRIASGSGDRTVRIWDVETDAELLRMEGHTDRIRGVAFSPDGKLVASCAQDSTVRIWNAEDGKPLHVLRGHADFVYGVAFSADGRSLFSCGMDAAVREWNTATGAQQRVFEGHLSWIRGLARSPDGARLISTGNDGAFIVWDVASGEAARFVRGHSTPVASATFIPGTQLAATAGYDQVIRLWSLSDFEPAGTLAGHETTIREIAASPDGRLLASVAEDDTLRLWNIAEMKEVFVIEVPSGFGTVSFSPNGQFVATGGIDGTVEIWTLPPRLLAAAEP